MREVAVGMKHWPESGYVIEVEKLFPLLSEDQRTQCEQLLEDGEEDAAQRLLAKSLFPTVRGIVSVFRFAEEDEPDGGLLAMEAGQVYVLFDTDVLYVQQPTEQLQVLQERLGEVPRLCHWARYS